jgi:hypothetical protein
MPFVPDKGRYHETDANRYPGIGQIEYRPGIKRRKTQIQLDEINDSTAGMHDTVEQIAQRAGEHHSQSPTHQVVRFFYIQVIHGQNDQSEGGKNGKKQIDRKSGKNMPGIEAEHRRAVLKQHQLKDVSGQRFNHTARKVLHRPVF